MFKMKRFFHLVLAAVMLLSCIQVPSAYAADTPTTVTVNVTNTPVRGDIVLEKTISLLLTLPSIPISSESSLYHSTLSVPVSSV